MKKVMRKHGISTHKKPILWWPDKLYNVHNTKYIEFTIYKNVIPSKQKPKKLKRKKNRK